MTTRIPTRAKSIFFLLSATGAAAVAIQASNPNFPITSRDLVTDFPQRIGAGISATVRSSRAIFTIASNVVDYKYSLHGMDADSAQYRAHLSEVHLRAARRILQLCETNKGFYVKAGQFIAAMRQVPKEYTATLSCLQDQAVPCDFKAIKAVLIRSLGKELSDVFMFFEEHPLAAASIAQVHRAVLKDHQEVAVKVQYPGLEQQMLLDTLTMSFLSTFVAMMFPEYRFQWAVSEFVKTVSLELDFIQEAKNSEKTAKNFMTNKLIKVPRVFWEFTSGPVLIMELCRGNKVDDLEFIKRNRISPSKVGKVLVDLFAEMIFIHGFVHGDPHPGNILISPEGEHGFSLVLLDHGIYRHLDEDFRKEYCRLWKAMILLDAKSIYTIGERFGIGRYAKFLPLIFTGRTIDSKSALGKGMTSEETEKMKLELKQLKMDDISSFLESLPQDFLAILRTDGLLRSILSKLGSSHRVRLVSYAKHALYGLALKLDNEHGHEVKMVRTSIKTSLSYLRLRLLIEIIELLSWMDDVRHLVIIKMQEIVHSASQYLWFRQLPLSVS